MAGRCRSPAHPIPQNSPLLPRDAAFSLCRRQLGQTPAFSFPFFSPEHRGALGYLQFFRMTKTSPHSSSEGRKISGTTMRILRLGGGLMFQVHSTLAG